jgi:hypothetical protein
MPKLDPTQPLWLPKGSVQAVLAVIVVVTFAAIALRSNIVFEGKDVITITTLVLGFYFIVKAALASPSNGG